MNSYLLIEKLKNEKEYELFAFGAEDDLPSEDDLKKLGYGNGNRKIKINNFQKNGKEISKRTYKNICRNRTIQRISKCFNISKNKIKVVLNPSYGYCYNSLIFIKK